MGKKLDGNLLLKLLSDGLSYKQIIEQTGLNRNSVYGFFVRNNGKLTDPGKSRRQSIEISDIQKEVLFGTLMGDGNLQKMPNSYFGRINHSLSQLEYCSYLRNELENLTYSVKFVDKTLKNYPGRIYNQCYFCFKPNEKLKDIYEMFYYKGKKDVPENLELLTPRAMAFWFMDDGRASGRCTIDIATNSFSLDGLTRLKEFLKSKYNLNVVISKDFRLYFKAESGRKFYSLIKDYLIKEMMYKFKYVNTSADLKQGELLGHPRMEDNQQPSLGSNILEGSTTNSRVQTDNAEDSNADTSALPQVILNNFSFNKDKKLVKIY